MPMMWSGSDMDNDTEKVEQSVSIVGIIHGIKQSQLEGECNAIAKLNILSKIFLKLEPLEMESKNVRKLLYFHAFFRFLQVAT